MDRRRILWYPISGIDATQQIAGGDFIDTCWDATNVCVYEDNIVRSRTQFRLTGINLENASQIIQAEQVASLDGDPRTYTYVLTDIGLFRDSSLIYEYVTPTTARMAVFKNTIIIGFGEDTGDTIVILDPQDGSDVTVKTLGAVTIPFGAFGYPFVYDNPLLGAGSQTDFLTYVDSYNSTTNILTLIGSPTQAWAAGMKVMIHNRVIETGENTVYIGTIATVTDATHMVMSDDWDEDVEPPTVDFDPLVERTQGVAGVVQVMTRSEYIDFLNTVYGSFPDVNLTVYYKIQLLLSTTGTASTSRTADKAVVFKYFAANPVLKKIPVVWPTVPGFFEGASYPDDFDTVRIFRYDPRVTTEQVYRLVHEEAIEDMSPYVDGSYTFVDWTDDYTLISGAEETWVEDRNYPPVDEDGNIVGFRFVMFYANRLWGIWKTRVYYSEPYDRSSSFEYYGPLGLNYFEFTDNPVVLLNGVTSLYVVCSSSVWILGGTNPEAMIQRKVLDKIGAFNVDACLFHSGNLYSVTNDGRLYTVFGQSFGWMNRVNALLEANPGDDYKTVMEADGDNLWITRRGEEDVEPGDNEGVFELTAANQDGYAYHDGGTGHFDATSNGIALGHYEPGTYAITTFLYFPVVNIIRGSTIDSARIDFTGYTTRSAQTFSVKIYAAADGSPAVPTSYADIDALDLTTATVEWTPAGGWSAKAVRSSADITTVIQEIVDRPDWSYGNPMLLLLVGEDAPGFHVCTSYEVTSTDETYPTQKLYITV